MAHIPKHLLSKTGLPDGIVDIIFEYHGDIALRFGHLYSEKIKEIQPFKKYMTEHYINLKLWNTQNIVHYTFTYHHWVLTLIKEMLYDIIQHKCDVVYLCDEGVFNPYDEKRWCKIVGKTPKGRKVLIEDHKTKRTMWIPFNSLYNFKFITRTYNETEITELTRKGITVVKTQPNRFLLSHY